MKKEKNELLKSINTIVRF